MLPRPVVYGERQDRLAGLCNRSVLPKATATYAGGSHLLLTMGGGGGGVFCFGFL